MLITPTPIPGAVLVAPELLVDERGFFARTVCKERFARYGVAHGFLTFVDYAQVER